ncbi:MAG: hydroxyphenylacetyl-CoA thioesterase PaaI [Marivibrio sp.]|uniref:hydroxyphenylacetyl-CoA thioesterase PaaI n=1 Tax=Marivibrio sp. TaxID=2039719 RepID=UPI0032EEF4CE
MPETETDPQKIAEAAAKAMYEKDNASRALGIEIVEVGPGTATLAMTVREDMVNGHAICHGGLIFTLADSAFAFGCNAYNHVTVASGCEIAFVAPAKLGDRLTAVCREKILRGRNGVYDIDVSNQDGAPVAYFRGKSRQIKGQIVPGLTAKN